MFSTCSVPLPRGAAAAVAGAAAPAFARVAFCESVAGAAAAAAARGRQRAWPCPCTSPAACPRPPGTMPVASGAGPAGTMLVAAGPAGMACTLLAGLGSRTAGQHRVPLATPASAGRFEPPSPAHFSTHVAGTMPVAAGPAGLAAWTLLAGPGKHRTPLAPLPALFSAH